MWTMSDTASNILKQAEALNNTKLLRFAASSNVRDESEQHELNTTKAALVLMESCKISDKFGVPMFSTGSELSRIHAPQDGSSTLR